MQMLLRKLPTNAVKSQTTPVFIWFHLVTHSSSGVTAKVCLPFTVQWPLRKPKLCRLCAFLCVYLFSLNVFHVSLKMQLKSFSREWKTSCFLHYSESRWVNVGTHTALKHLFICIFTQWNFRTTNRRLQIASNGFHATWQVHKVIQKHSESHVTQSHTLFYSN